MKGLVGFEIGWHAWGDACDKCITLDGQKWFVAKTELTGILTHPEFGAVYDIDADVSLTHPNCKCWVFVEPLFELMETEAGLAVAELAIESGQPMPSNIQEIRDEIATIEEKTNSAAFSTRQVEMLLFRTLGYMQRLGLPEDINHAIRIIQRVTMAIRMVHTSIAALEVASGPIGWWRLGLTMAGVGFAVGGVVTESMATYDSSRGT